MSTDMNKGAKGVLVTTLESLDFKTTARGKRYAMLKLERGGVVFRASSFAQAATKSLEAFTEGESCCVFGLVESRDVDGKVYTDFKILKVYEEPQDDAGIFVTGTVKDSGSTKYEKWVDIDTTADPEYPSFVRISYAKDSSREFSEGEEVIDLRVSPKGRFGVWTLLETKPAAKRTQRPASKPAPAPVDPAPANDDDIPW